MPTIGNVSVSPGSGTVTFRPDPSTNTTSTPNSVTSSTDASSSAATALPPIMVQNSGSGSGLYVGSTFAGNAQTLLLKTLVAGTGIALSVTADSVIVTATGTTSSTTPSNTSLSFTGAVTGSATLVPNAPSLTIALGLAASGVTAGTYTSVVVDAAGRVLSGSASSSSSSALTLTGDVSGSGTSPISVTLNTSGVVAGSYTKVVVNAKGLVTGGISLTQQDVTTALGYTPVNTVAGRTGNVVLTIADVSYAAPLASPALTGNPTAPTVALSDSSTALATTAFVKGQAYLTANQALTISGDAQGSGSTSLVLTLATITTPATYDSVVVDAKGRVTYGTNPVHSITGDATGSGTTSIALSLTTTGVTPGTYALPTIVVDGKGRVLSASSGTGAVTSIATGTGLSGGPITGSGTIVLANTTVVPGSYTLSTITVNAQGQIIAASSGTTVTQPITLTGDVSGSGTSSLAVSLANVGTAGSYTSVITDSKGRVVSGGAFAAVDVTTALGFTPANASTAAPLASPAFTGTPTAPTPLITDSSIKLATTAFVKGQNYLTGNQTISITGDATASGTTSLSLTLVNVGITAGTYTKVVVNAKGLVTAAASLAFADITTALGFTPVSNLLVGASNGLATLDNTGKLTTAQIPSALVGAVVYEGVWNASTNAPILTSGTGTKGFYYKVSVGGTTTLDANSSWSVNDIAIYNGTAWDKIDGEASVVTSVAGRIGAIALTIADVSGAAPLASPIFTGTPTGPTVASTDNSGTLATTAFVKQQSYLTTNQSITVSGDASGSGATSIALTLAPSGVTAGTYAGLVINAKGLVISAVANAYLTANQAITLSGDVSGTGSTAITTSLATTGVAAGTYSLSQIVVDAKGRILSASNGSVAGASGGTVTQVNTGTGLTGGPITGTGTIALANTAVTVGTYSLSSIVVNAQGQITSAASGTPQTITISGDASGSGTAAIALTLANTGVSAGTYNSVVVNTKGLVTAATSSAYLTANQSISLSGDASGSGTTTITVSLANTGVVAGTYSLSQIVVDAKGRVVSASNGAASTTTGTVTQVNSGTGLTGGPITSTGTLAIANTGVAAGTYSFATVVVNAQGQITSATAGGLGTPATTIASSGATQTLAFPATGNAVFDITLTASCTITLSGGSVGQSNTLKFYIKNGTGGFTYSFSPAPLWPNATAPTVNTAANEITVITLETHDACTTIYGSY